jgi:thiosulfate reductase cytochrome b subunit
MVTFLLQAATGLGRLYVTTAWGQGLCAVFGGYESALVIHIRVGVVMIVGFLLHVLYLVTRIDYGQGLKGLFGPDSLLPNLDDLRRLGRQLAWFFGLGPKPVFDRWTYWEKFDYWAVFWGMPLLALTGLMLLDPVATSRTFPGWWLNVAALIHRAEAVLAVAYIFIVHFFVGHLRPHSFPMNEAMFAGSVALPGLAEEKPLWLDRLRREGRLDQLTTTAAPAAWYRTVYFIFGYAALAFGLYLLISGLIYSPQVTLH